MSEKQMSERQMSSYAGGQGKSLLIFIIFTVSVMLLILSLSIAAPLVIRPFYYAHITALKLPESTGWSYAEIKQAYDEMMDFCMNGAPFGAGILRWSEEGMQHFADCRVLFMFDFKMMAAGAVLLVLGHILYAITGKKTLRPLGKGPLFWAAAALAAFFILLVILVAAVDFDSAFVTFHHLFFPGKCNWLFDPAADQIILVLPEVFFMDAAIFIVVLILLFCVLAVLADRRFFSRRSIKA